MNHRFHNIQIVSSSTKNNEFRFSNSISKLKSLFNNYTKNWKKKRKRKKETKNELCLQALISSSMSSEVTPRSREKLLGFMTFPLLPIATKIQRSKINKIKLTKPLHHKFAVLFIYIAYRVY